MLELLNKDATNLFIDGLLDLVRQGEIQKIYDVNTQQMCQDLDVNANLDIQKLTFTFNLSYRSYPASLKLAK